MLCLVIGRSLIVGSLLVACDGLRSVTTDAQMAPVSCTPDGTGIWVSAMTGDDANRMSRS